MVRMGFCDITDVFYGAYGDFFALSSLLLNVLAAITFAFALIVMKKKTGSMFSIFYLF